MSKCFIPLIADMYFNISFRRDQCLNGSSVFTDVKLLIVCKNEAWWFDDKGDSGVEETTVTVGRVFIPKRYIKNGISEVLSFIHILKEIKYVRENASVPGNVKSRM